MDDASPLQSRLLHCADCAPQGGVRRRGLLFGALGSAALAACSTPTVTSAPMAGTGSAAPALNLGRGGRVDVHHHASPAPWVALGRSRGVDGPAVSWTVEKSLADMDRAGVQTAMLSVTTPGIVFPDMDRATSRKLARDCNEWLARLVADHPGRFGFFAALPMLDTEGALQEMAYALDTLKADGIGMLTSYEDKWLGDPSFFPIMEELDRRRAVVYTHPTAPACCRSLQANVQPVMIEFGTDTTRTIASILFNGNASRFREIRWIFSHGGGTMPYLVERFVRNPILVPGSAALFPQGVLPELRRFYYDTAQVPNAAALSALTKVVPPSQIVFGTDYPYRTALDHVQGLRAAGLFDDTTLAMIERQTPLSLLPRVRLAQGAGKGIA